MQRTKRGSATGGILLILIGAAFLAWTLAPDQVSQFIGPNSWPLIVVAMGALFLFVGLVSRTGGFLIPAMILAGTGAILYYQNLTGDWESWAYVWPLTPGLVGLGLLLAGLIDPQMRAARKVGLYMAAIAFTIFAILWSLFAARMDLNYVWPVVLILVGLGFLLRAAYKR